MGLTSAIGASTPVILGELIRLSCAELVCHVILVASAGVRI